MDDPVEEVPTEAPADPMAAVLNMLADWAPGSIPVNVLMLVEWIEPDGSGGMSYHGTPMSPWLAEGMLKYAIDNGMYPQGIVAELPAEDEDEVFVDDDWDDED